MENENIVIYIKPTCPFCAKAKALFHEKGVAYEEIDISNKNDLRQEMIEKANGRTTVPQIFISGKHIGGCDDLMALEEKGELNLLLQ